MFRFIYILSFIFIFQSCGMLINGDVMEGGTREFSSTNPIFQPYISNFEEYAKQVTQDPNFRIGDIPVNFGDTRKPQYDGVCLKYSNGQREVIIKKSFWDSSSATQKEVLLFHELGHCRLNRSHDNDIYENHKTSIMSSVVPTAGDYYLFKSEYLTELFTGNKNLLLNSISN